MSIPNILAFVCEPMACPYFLPIEKFESSWLHPQRLPLGCGWKGLCGAPGYEGESPSDEELREFCNMGYAQGCARLPQDRAWDSVRFGARVLSKNGNGSAVSNDNQNHFASGRIQIRYICERDHRPAAQGALVFEVPSRNAESKDGQARCEQAHPNACLQKMAERFLQSYLEKISRGETEQAIA